MCVDRGQGMHVHFSMVEFCFELSEIRNLLLHLPHASWNYKYRRCAKGVYEQEPV